MKVIVFVKATKESEAGGVPSEQMLRESPSGDLFGLTVTANGWHALFHMLPGLVGIAAAWRPRAAFAYLLVAGALYIMAGGWGLIAGGSSVGVIAVDTTGDLVHLIEGLFTFAAGILTLPTRVRSS